MDTQENLLKAKKWPQYLAATIAILSSASSGSAMGWSAPALPYLESITDERDIFRNVNENFTNYTSKFLTKDESSLIGSLLTIGALFGSLPAGLMCEKFGRITTLQFANVFLVAGWAILCTINCNVVMTLFIARILHGCALGICSVAVPLYNEEIVQVEIRGAIGVFFNFSLSLGVLWVYVFGTIITYFWMNISCAVLTVASVIGLLFVPESPVYLLQKLQDEKAKRALEWLRGANSIHKYDVASELLVLRRIVDVSRQKTERNKSSECCFHFKKVKCKQFSSPTAKAFYIIMFLMILRQFSGINPITFYAVYIFQETESYISPYLSTTIGGLAQMLFTVLVFAAVDKIGRRVFLLISSSAIALSLFLLCGYFYLKQINFNTEAFSWIPTFCIGLFFAMFSTGLGPIPWFMMAEIVPTQSKVWVTGVCSMTNWLCASVGVQMFLYMLRDLGNSGTYLFYAVLNITGFVIIIFAVPETKNKSIETIQEELSNMRLKCK